jgi:hypothetical protein
MTLHTGYDLKNWSVHHPKERKTYVLPKGRQWKQYENELLCGFLEEKWNKNALRFLKVFVPTFAT